MIKISTIIYYVCVVIMSASMCMAGYGINTWQFWMVLFAMIISRICGQEEG